MENKSIYEEMEKIKERIRELDKKSGVGCYREGDIWPGDSRTKGEREEWEQLQARLDELKKEDDKSLGL